MSNNISSSSITNRVQRWSKYLATDPKGMILMGFIEKDIPSWNRNVTFVASQIDSMYRHSIHHHTNQEIVISKAKTISQFFSFITIVASVFNLELTTKVE